LQVNKDEKIREMACEIVEGAIEHKFTFADIEQLFRITIDIVKDIPLGGRECRELYYQNPSTRS
jgi:hypothetical protein